MTPAQKAKVRRQIRGRQKTRRRLSAGQRLFTWESRPATLADDGMGFFSVVGGYDVLVRERKTGRPVTGGMVIVNSERELGRKATTMLNRFAPQWLAQSPTERTKNMKLAARIVRQCGWSI